MKNIKITFFVCIIGTLLSCNINNKKFDSENGEEKVKEIADSLYVNIQQAQYENVINLFGKRFFEVTKREDLHTFLEINNKEFGALKRRELISWRTSERLGNNPITEYVFIYKVKYEKATTKETVNFVDENGVIKIIGYFVKVDI